MPSRGTGSPTRRALASLVLAVAAVTPALPASPAAARSCPPPPPPAAAPPSAPVLAAPTQIHWTRVSRLLVHGSDAVLEGQVVTEEGALGGVRVDLYARPAGATDWTRVSGTTSDDDTGVFSFGCVMPGRTTTYRVEYAGDALHAPSRDDRTVQVARSLDEDIRRTGPATFVLDGTVSPRYRGPVLLRHRPEGGGWTVVARRTADPRSQYAFTVDVSRLRGLHEYQVVVPADGAYARSTGTRWRISVR